ncbi:MAG TPA: ATP-dependent RecD-like DNA helicase [Thermomicrobiaceae bacterium]|nr:ATP-dependent RecD-like DNA helicase [Thermomicrobiaceae bacterium]
MAADPVQPAIVSSALVEIEGTVERITFSNPTTGYTVLKLATRRGAEIAVVGELAGANPGATIKVQGVWQTHPRHGRQFMARGFETALPATTEGVRKYLGSGLIRGVGPVTASRIVEHFGADALQVIDEQAERLFEVPGLGPKRAQAIAEAWKEQAAIKDVMIFLQSHGVHTGLAVRIYKQYADDAIAVVQSDPYRLARDIWGIGFKTADKIGAALGIPNNAPARLTAGVRYALSQAADNDGHLYLPLSELLERSAALLESDPDEIELIVPQLDHSGDIFIESDEDGERVYLAPHGGAEIAVARRLIRLWGASEDRLATFQQVSWERAFDWLITARQAPPLAARQVEAVRTALTERVAILTGGPGTGKSTTIRSVVELARAKRARVILAAPTGRAAKRLAELTGQPASTIHRLLKINVGGVAAFNEQQPLDTDLIVVDEASMLDIFLINTLLKAVPPGAHLLLVGDIDQLPSVGPGTVLRDAIESDALPVVRLTDVFRQAEQSAIIRNAHRINRGDMPEWGRQIHDFAVLRLPNDPRVDAPSEAATTICELIERRLPAAYGLRPEEIQVLSPMNGGPAGTRNLNFLLQEKLNPPRPHVPEMRAAGRTIRINDRLIALRNNYQLEVFNGDLGYVRDIDMVEQTVGLALDDGRMLRVPFSQMDEFNHAFAISVHRAQGSEFRAVVLPLLTSHYVMLQRNLLYTAITRARELAVIVGQTRAIAIAVKNDHVAHRYSRLKRRLQDFRDEAEQAAERLAAQAHDSSGSLKRRVDR